MKRYPGPNAPLSVVQPWVSTLPFMQQTVLLSGAIRGPDQQEKYSKAKFLLRWMRRCILWSALDGEILETPYNPRGGSFTGPSYNLDDMDFRVGWEKHMEPVVGEYIKSLDGLPFHFSSHFLHAVEVIGYKHPDQRIRSWWHSVYLRLVNDLHLHPETEEQMDFRLGGNRETEEQMDFRLGGNRENWLSVNEPATTE